MQNSNVKGSEPVSVDLTGTAAILLAILLNAATYPPLTAIDNATQVTGGLFAVDVYSALGHIGVPLLVMLSGFLMLEPSKADEPLGDFFRKRFSRVLLPFIFWSLAYFAWNIYVHGAPLTLDNVIETFMSGTYGHLWYLYLLLGLYLVTPLLRVFIKFLDWKRFKYLMALWLVGTVAISVISFFSSFYVNLSVFLFTGWIGYYLLGVFLQKTKAQTWILASAVCLGVAVAVLGAYVTTVLIGEEAALFFYESLSFNIIIASGAVYMLLMATSNSRGENRYGKLNSILHWVGQNTLPVYLLHYMILESLMLGFFGFSLNAAMLDPAILVPLLTVLTFGLTVLIVYPLKKIPVIKRLIG